MDNKRVKSRLLGWRTTDCPLTGVVVLDARRGGIDVLCAAAGLHPHKPATPPPPQQQEQELSRQQKEKSGQASPPGSGNVKPSSAPAAPKQREPAHAEPSEWTNVVSRVWPVGVVGGWLTLLSHASQPSHAKQGVTGALAPLLTSTRVFTANDKIDGMFCERSTGGVSTYFMKSTELESESFKRAFIVLNRDDSTSVWAKTVDLAMCAYMYAFTYTEPCREMRHNVELLEMHAFPVMFGSQSTVDKDKVIDLLNLPHIEFSRRDIILSHLWKSAISQVLLPYVDQVMGTKSALVIRIYDVDRIVERMLANLMDFPHFYVDVGNVEGGRCKAALKDYYRRRIGFDVLLKSAVDGEKQRANLIRRESKRQERALLNEWCRALKAGHAGGRTLHWHPIVTALSLLKTSQQIFADRRAHTRAAAHYSVDTRAACWPKMVESALAYENPAKAQANEYYLVCRAMANFVANDKAVRERALEDARQRNRPPVPVRGTHNKWAVDAKNYDLVTDGWQRRHAVICNDQCWRAATVTGRDAYEVCVLGAVDDGYVPRGKATLVDDLKKPWTWRAQWCGAEYQLDVPSHEYADEQDWADDQSADDDFGVEEFEWRPEPNTVVQPKPTPTQPDGGVVNDDYPRFWRAKTSPMLVKSLLWQTELSRSIARVQRHQRGGLLELLDQRLESTAGRRQNGVAVIIGVLFLLVPAFNALIAFLLATYFY